MTLRFFYAQLLGLLVAHAAAFFGLYLEQEPGFSAPVRLLAIIVWWTGSAMATWCFYKGAPVPRIEARKRYASIVAASLALPALAASALSATFGFGAILMLTGSVVVLPVAQTLALARFSMRAFSIAILGALVAGGAWWVLSAFDFNRAGTTAVIAGTIFVDLTIALSTSMAILWWTRRKNKSIVAPRR